MTAALDLYPAFLASKVAVADRTGFAVNPSDLHPDNFPHQNDAIIWAASLGRALIAMSFGLGKTRQQCELARLIHERTGQPFLIICPLGVKHQFQEEDGPALGMTWQYVRTDEEVRAATTPYLITNYERVRDGSINPRLHSIAGVSLDEGSVLRSLGSKTSQTFKDVFRDTPYRFVATATPSPNNYRELIYYAEFLGIMDVGHCLTRWFKRNPDKAGDLQLMEQHEHDFWLWVASWAFFLFTPSDLGYDDTGYILPPLKVRWHPVSVDQTRAFAQTDSRGQHRLLLDAAGGVSEAAAEKRATLNDRLAKAIEIVSAAPADEHWLLWHHQERERHAIEKLVPGAVTVYGSQDLETREERIIGFARGTIRILATKPEIAGSGCNFQRHCHRNIFVGVDYKFQDFIQAIHRTFRFQQEHSVEVDIIYAESEEQIVRVLKDKWDQHNQLVEQMRVIIRKYGLSHERMKRDLSRVIGIPRAEHRGELFMLVNNDCVDECRRLPDNSIGQIVTSIPFGNHFEYTEQIEDFGHNPSDDAFFDQMDFLLPELYRILKPGRVASIHVKDRILYGHQTKTGFMEVGEFSDDTVKSFKKHGFLYEGRRTIVTDVVRENNSTYRLGWSELCKDSSKMGSGLPEYLLTFRKPPTSTVHQYADEPVVKDKAEYSLGRWQVDAHSLWRSSGNRHLTPDELAEFMPDQVSKLYAMEQLNTVYNHERHVAICEALERRKHLPRTFMLLPPKVTQNADDPAVWDDVNAMRCLNSEQAQKRRENHLCPLPFDIVERAIRLYSNPGDVILDPFAGLGTTPYIAVKLGRYGHGVELNATYFAAAIVNCKNIEAKITAPMLFDLLEEMEEEPV